MSKFLSLLESHDPENATSPKWKLIDFLKSKGVNVSLVKGTDMVYIDTGEDTIAVNISSNEEDAESIEAGYGDYDVNKEVEGLAGKAAKGLKGVAGKLFGNTAQQAKTAVAQRQGVAKQAVGAYQRKTQQLQKDIQNVGKTQ
jgi:hypothetical protein